MTVAINPNLHPLIAEFCKGIFPDPDPTLSERILAELNLNLTNWTSRRGWPVVFWGWHPHEMNTMTFEQDVLRRAFHFLGFNTYWYECHDDPRIRLANLPSPRIYLTGNGAPGDRLVPFVTENDIVISHNEWDPKRWRGKLFNYCQFAVPSRSSPGLIVPYPSDLLPHEIDINWLNQKDNQLAFFVGSPYSAAFAVEHAELRKLFESAGIEYSFLQTWNGAFVHQGYCVSRWIPVPQLPEITAFLPSRFYKGMARGCIPLSINPVAHDLLGEGAKYAIFGSNWRDVVAQVTELCKKPDELNELSLGAMNWSRSRSALHFLEYIWPAEDHAKRSPAYFETQESAAQADNLVTSLERLREVNLRFKDNRLAMLHLGSFLKGLKEENVLAELIELGARFNRLFPNDPLSYAFHIEG